MDERRERRQAAITMLAFTATVSALATVGLLHYLLVPFQIWLAIAAGVVAYRLPRQTIAVALAATATAVVAELWTALVWHVSSKNDTGGGEELVLIAVSIAWVFAATTIGALIGARLARRKAMLPADTGQ